MSVAVQGSGLVGLTCAQLLAARGREVELYESSVRPRNRVVALAPTTQQVLESLWAVPLPELARVRRVERRHVAWTKATIDTVPAPAVTVHSGDLLDALRARLDRRVRVVESTACAPAEFSLVAQGAPSLRAGRRVATEAISAAELPHARDATLIISLRWGWLFAAPRPGSGTAWTLISPPDLAGPEALRCAASEQWPSQPAAHDLYDFAITPCAPSFEPACASEESLRVGEAVLRLDPLRGDGVGFALRGALLAAAVLCADEADAARVHYRARMADVFRAHLSQCIAHYECALHSEPWRQELVDMKAALERVAAPTELAYRLIGPPLGELDARGIHVPVARERLQQCREMLLSSTTGLRRKI